MIMATPKKAKKKVAPEIRKLKLALKALKGAEHNPTEWGAILAWLASILAPIIIKKAVTYTATKVGKKITPKKHQEISEFLEDWLGSTVEKHF